MLISNREIWDGIPHEDRIAILAGRYQEFPTLHKILREIQAEDAEAIALTKAYGHVLNKTQPRMD
jgi:hypothetical protein